MVFAPILSCVSIFLTTGRASSPAGTAGDISFSGFPIWFHESAPGFSLVDGWHVDRFVLNTTIWAVIIIFVFFLCARFLRRRA